MGHMSLIIAEKLSETITHLNNVINCMLCPAWSIFLRTPKYVMNYLCSHLSMSVWNIFAHIFRIYPYGYMALNSIIKLLNSILITVMVTKLRTDAMVQCFDNS
jgi:hypothetical protein